MDTSVCIACGMMREWKAVAPRERLETRTLGVPRARSGGRGYPDRNSASLLRMSPASSPLDAGPSDNVTLPTLIFLINYARLHTMPGCKNPMPADEAAACRTKLAALEQAHEQLLEEECEAVARREREAAAWHEHEVAGR